MSKARAHIVSPARSQGAGEELPPRQRRTSGRRAVSAASFSARSGAGASPRLSSVIDKFINQDKFTVSPLKRRSVLPDDTDIEAPRRASWWKRLEGSSRDVLEALDTNKMPNDLLVEDYEFEVDKDKQNQTVPESSDNESVASIVVPQRRLFNQKKQSHAKFGEMMGSRKSLGKTNIEDVSIDDAPKKLFNKGPRNRPVFPAALLNSTNKTINKTVEPETGKQTRPNLFGQAGTKRKNMFTDFVLSDSEEDSEVQHKVFEFKKNENKRMSLGTRNRRMPSLTPSMTTEIDIDDWNLLPSSTMIDNAIGNPEVSRIITDKDIEQAHDEHQDITLTEDNVSMNYKANKTSNINNIENKSTNKTKLNKSVILNDDNNKTLTNENIETADASERHKVIKEVSATQEKNKINTNHQESIIAGIQGESIRKDKSQNIIESTTENKTSVNEIKVASHSNRDREEIEGSPEIQDAKNISNQVHETYQSNKSHMVGKNKSENTIEPDCVEWENIESSKNASQKNEEEDMSDTLEKDESAKKIESIVEDQENPDYSKEENQEYLDQDKDLDGSFVKDHTEEEIDTSAEEQDIQDSSKDTSQESQDEDMEDTVEKEESGKDLEVSNEQQVIQEISKEAIQEAQDSETTGDQDKHYSPRETINRNQDEQMEEMVWDDDDDVRSNKEVEKQQNSESEHEKKINRDGSSKNVSNINHTILKFSSKEEQMQQDNDVIEETPDNSKHDTTERHRQDSTEIKSPEAVLQNVTKDNESFRPIGRSTTFRKSKSGLENINIRPSLTAIQESTIGSEGSRNSSTEGSGWDSHRTTRKTIRQTFGKDFTPRKSLRALVMEQSAKRQTELYNKNTSSINKNKTVKGENASRLNKSKNKTVLQDINKSNASKMNESKKNTALEDVNDHHIRDRRVSNLNLSSNQLSNSKSPVHETSTHHVSDPLITEPGLSYHKSLYDMNEPELSQQQLSNRADSINIPEQTNSSDSCPEISIHASYGQGMSAENSDHEALEEEYHTASDLKILAEEKSVGASNEDILRRDVSVRIKFQVTSDQEKLDYEASDTEKSEEEISETEEFNQVAQALSDHSSEEEEDEKHSDQPESENDSEPEESEHEQQEEDSQQEIESELDQPENESQQEIELELHEPEDESQQEIEPELDEPEEESQQEIESELDQPEDESEQEIEPELHEPEEESQQEIESELDQPGDESQQEIEPELDEPEEESQQEIESELDQPEEESQQEIESEAEVEAESEQESENEQDLSRESVNDTSRHEADQETAGEISEEPESSDEDVNNHFLLQMSNSNRTERVVFDNETSDRAMDYELSDADHHVSERQTPTPPPLRPKAARVPTETQRSMLLMQLQKIAEQNGEMRQKIREQVENSLKRRHGSTYNFNKLSPVRRALPPRRAPRAPTVVTSALTSAVTSATTRPAAALPAQFVADLQYKPPRRFQPASAPWITKRLYKFLETKLEPKYDYRARVRAEELVKSLHSFCRLVRRRDNAPAPAVDDLKREMARLRIVTTHHQFYRFFHDFMPREIRVKVNPDVVNKIPMPRGGVFSDILPPRAAH